MKLKTWQILLSLLIICLLSVPAFSQGTKAVDLAKITVGARQASMGGAFVGIANDINTLAMNPAGLSLLPRATVAGNYTDWIAGSSYGSVALGLPRQMGTFGIGMTYFNETEIEITDASGTPIGGKESVYDFRATLGYGAVLHKYVHFGTALTLTQTKLGPDTKGYGGLDMGFLFPVLTDRLTLGLAMRNFAVDALKTSPDTGDDLPPTSLTAGLGLFVHDFESVKINAGADVYIPFDEGSDPKENLGAEFIIKELLALRAGYRVNYDEEALTLGAGIHYKDFWVDYSYNDIDLLEDTHRFSVRMDFGEYQESGPIFGGQKLDDDDSDADGIVNYLDRCPNDPEDKDGYEDYDGCPDPDNDHDGIPDATDECPLLPETYNDHKDEDGCPDVVNTGMPMSQDEWKQIYMGAEGERGYMMGEKYSYIVPIYFDTGKATLREEAYPLLEQVAKLIDEDIEGVIFIEGHTDSRESYDFNQVLGENRAVTVKNALVTKYGVPEDILIPIGIGEAQPVAPNDSEENMQKNRRVIFRVWTKEEIYQ